MNEIMKNLIKTSLSLILVLLSVFTLTTNAYAEGAKYKGTKTNWKAHIEIDDPLMTGKHPASVSVLAKTLEKHLK